VAHSSAVCGVSTAEQPLRTAGNQTPTVAKRWHSAKRPAATPRGENPACARSSRTVGTDRTIDGAQMRR